MKVKWNLPKCDVEVEGDDIKHCFEQLAEAVEAFVAASRCGACDSTNTIPTVRNNGDYTFYEARCADCGCALAFGQRKSDGALFPKRNDRDNKRLENGGWTKWQPREDAAPQRQTEVPF